VAKTVVCLCLDVTAADLARLMRQGFAHSEALKRATGALMGPCQGKYCASTVLRVLGDLAVSFGDGSEVRRPAVRPPVAPVLLGHLAWLDEKLGSNDDAR
jgi:octopine oxidase subunit A